MIQQQGNALVFYAMFVASKVGKTGLTVTVDVYKNSSEIVTAGVATELGNGLYYYTLASGSVDADGTYIAVFKTADSSVDQQHVSSQWTVGPTWVNNLDAAITTRASQASVDSIGSGTGAALNFAAGDDNVDEAIKGVTFVGVQTSGTYASTAAEDGTRHQITHTGNAIDIVYQFDIGAGRNAAKVVFKGYVSGSNDTITVQAYNGSTWNTRATIVGQTGSTNTTKDIALLSTHTGTGADAGKVFIRFVCTGQSAPVLYIDELLVAGVAVGQSVGYADGAIWVDTTNGEAGTTPYIHGTADNPVSTWADALTLAASLSLTRFRIIGGSTVTLTGNSSSYSLVGDGLWSLVLGGQVITNAYVSHASVSGVSTGAGAIFDNCRITAGISTAAAYFVRCGFDTSSGSPFLAAAAGQYVMVDCVSLVAGSGTPYFNFSGTGGTTGVNFRRWSGGSNTTLDGNCTMTMEVVTGGGQTVTTGGGNVEIRGICRTVTIVSSGSSVTQFAGVTGPVNISGTGGTVRLYGVVGNVTDTSAPAVTVVNDSLSQETSDSWATALPGSYTAGQAGSILNGIKAVTDAIDLSDTIINVSDIVVGGTVTVTAGDTWRFTLTDTDLDMSSYETLAFAVKASDRQTENQAQIYVRTDTGLQRVAGAAALSTSNGSLTKDSATTFTVVVHMAETSRVSPGTWTWWIKAFDTTPAPDEAVTLAYGRFVVKYPGVQAST